MRDPWYRSSQTKFRPAATVTRSYLLKQSGDAKRTIRNHCDLTILQFFYSPFFQLNCYSWGYRAIHDISAHRQQASISSIGASLTCIHLIICRASKDISTSPLPWVQIMQLQAKSCSIKNQTVSKIWIVSLNVPTSQQLSLPTYIHYHPHSC